MLTNYNFQLQHKTIKHYSKEENGLRTKWTTFLCNANTTMIIYLLHVQSQK